MTSALSPIPAAAASSPRASGAGRAGERTEAGDPRLPVDRVSLSARAGDAGGAAVDRLDAEAQAEVRALEQRDTEVRTHEAAHQAASGGLAGSARFTYETGPDGRQYAVGGEVPIRSPGGQDPDEKIENARKVREAALAPADPSPQDLAVAARATQVELRARAEKARAAAEAYGRGGAPGSAPEVSASA